MIDPFKFFKSLRHALRGVMVVFRTEQSFRLQTYVGIVVLLCAWFFGVQVYEWIILILLIGAVLILELINSVFERMMDAFKPRIHPSVRDSKDILAGAVFIVSIISALIGLCIFYPYLQQLVALLRIMIYFR